MKYAGVALALSAVVVAGMASVHPFGNPRVAPPKGIDSLLVHANLPLEAKRVLITKCADCHSNETRWPVYARVPPGSWLIERDIVEARKKLNLSHWDEMPLESQEIMAGKIIHEAKNGEMPPFQYRLLHWSSKLTPEDVASLSRLQHTAAPQERTSGPGDALRGKAVFEKRCTGCHAMTADREGPRMTNVFGRKAGSVEQFDYSAALKNSGITWDEATLETWLADPDTMVLNNKMDFRLPKAQERADVIAYFKQSR